MARMTALAAAILVAILVVGVLSWKFLPAAPDTKTAPEAQTIAMRLTGERIEPIATVSGEGSPLPKDLFISPSRYAYRGQTYDMTRPGLYRFAVPGIENQQRVVFGGDVMSMMSAMSWIAVHGNADDALGVDGLSTAAPSRAVSVTCGTLAVWTRALLDSLGVDSRLAVTMTLDAWNAYDNGHTMLEVKIDGKWRLFDLDGNAYFIGADGHHLSLVEFVEAVKDDSYREVKIAADAFQDSSGFDAVGGYDWAFVGDMTFADRRAWFRRVAQVPLIQDPENALQYLFASTKDTARLTSYSAAYAPVSAQAFLRLAAD